MIETISEALGKATVTLNLQSRKKADVISELVGSLVNAGAIADPKPVTDAVIEREAMMSTGIGEGVAVPHCLTSAVDRTVIAFGRHRKGIKFDAVDNKPVKLFFLMVGPLGAHSEHLRLLSRLSRLLRDETFKSTLLEAETADEVVDTFDQRERERGG